MRRGAAKRTKRACSQPLASRVGKFTRLCNHCVVINLQVASSGCEVYPRFTSRLLSFRPFCAKVPTVIASLRGCPRPRRPQAYPRNPMKVPDKAKSRTNSENKRPRRELEKTECLSFASTDEVRALLSDLSTRSSSQREFFYTLLKRAAAQAISTDSVIDPADSHHTSTS